MSDRSVYVSQLATRSMTDEEYEKFKNKKEARRLQKETGMKYTEALRQVQASKENN